MTSPLHSAAAATVDPSEKSKRKSEREMTDGWIDVDSPSIRPSVRPSTRPPARPRRPSDHRRLGKGDSDWNRGERAQMPFFRSRRRRHRHRHHCPLTARARSANGGEKTCKNDDGGGGTTDMHSTLARLHMRSACGWVGGCV